MAAENKRNPLTVVFHCSDEAESEMLSPELAKKLAERIGKAASELISDESYIRLAQSEAQKRLY